MALPNRKNRPVYLRYLSAKYGSAMIASACSIADTAMVGRYLGPEGTDGVRFFRKNEKMKIGG